MVQSDAAGQRSRRPRDADRVPGRILGRGFYETLPELVCPRLLGKLLVNRSPEGIIAGRIVEAEAYLGPHNTPPDPAAHSHRGPTPRTLVLFGLAGHAYVYSIYGMYFCLNVSCETEGLAGSVLLRALEPVAGLELMAANRGLPAGMAMNGALLPRLSSGPGRLCQALGVTRPSHNGLDLTDAASPLEIRDDGYVVKKAMATPRIGIKEAADWPLRFAIPGNPCVSGPKGLKGKLVTIP